MARVCANNMGARLSDDAQEAMANPVATAMAYALCDPSEASADALFQDLLKAGVSVEDVCLDHLAPAARCLGEWWENDKLPFTEVTMATARIQSMMRRMPASRARPSLVHGQGALFAAVPGEQHTLGVMMAADLFRRNGWDVGLLVGQTHDQLVSRLGRDDRPVIGLSCSGDHSYPALMRVMRALRKSRPDAHILLSGQIVDHEARLADLPQPFTVVRGVADAEAEMARIGEIIDATRRAGPGRMQAVS